MNRKHLENSAPVFQPFAVDFETAAPILGAALWRVRELVRTGQLVAFKLPGTKKQLLLVDDLKLYIAQQRQRVEN